MSNTMVRKCTCASSQQDKLHGKGNRVHNRTKQANQESERRWRCTSCKKESL